MTIWAIWEHDMWDHNQETINLKPNLIGNLMKNAVNVQSVRINLTSWKESIIAVNAECKFKNPVKYLSNIGSYVHHVVETIGMYQDTQTRRWECVITATKNGWLTRFLHITSIKPLFFHLISGTMHWLKSNECKSEWME